MNTRTFSQPFQLLRFGLLLVVTSLSLTRTFASQTSTDIRPLEPGVPVERELTGGQSHSYRIVLTAGQYLHVVADQRGIDVIVTLFAPDGKQIEEVDSPNGTQGPEPILLIAETSGNYRLEVRSSAKEEVAGRYEVTLAELRTATAQDRNRVAAEHAFIEGEQLRLQGTAESMEKSIEKYAKGLSLFQALGDGSREATTLYLIGFVYSALGKDQTALNYYEQALPLFHAIGDGSSEAATLASTGASYDALGEKQKALLYYEQAVPLLRVAGDRNGEARTLSNIGFVYDSLGEKHKALDYYGQALTLSRGAGDQSSESITLSNIGRVYEDLGEKQKALDYYLQALLLSRAVRDQSAEATTLNNVGFVYYLLGESKRALDYFGQSLSLLRIVGDRSGEARTLSNTGAVYDSLGDRQKALQYYDRALPLLRSAGDRIGEAAAFNSMGTAYEALGENQKALDYYGQSLSLFRAVGERRGEARALSNIGTVSDKLGEKQEALDYFNSSLPLARAVGDRSAEANTLNRLMTFYESLNRPRLAIFYGKQSVFAYQQLRSNSRGLDKDVQKNYLKTVEQAYRHLTNLLIELGRLAEARQILNAFKDQQFFDFDQGEARKPTSLNYTLRESEFLVRYEKAIESLAVLDGKVAELKRKLGNRQAAEEEAQQLRELEAQRLTAADQFAGLLKEAESKFSKPADEKDRVGEVTDTTQMQGALRQLKREMGQTTVAVYTLVGETKFYALIITADSISSGLTYYHLNDKTKALDYFHQALAARGAAGLLPGVAVPLSNIGSIYYSLGDRRRALHYYMQALPLRRALGDRAGVILFPSNSTV